MVNEQDAHKPFRQLGQRVQQIRKAMGLTQTALEQKSGVYDVGAIERGETNPTLMTLIKLANALDVELKVLFDIEEEISEENRLLLEIRTLLEKQDETTQKKVMELLRVFLT